MGRIESSEKGENEKEDEKLHLCCKFVEIGREFSFISSFTDHFIKYIQFYIQDFCRRTFGFKPQ